MATVVDIDLSVVEMSIEYLPTLSNGAYEDARTNLVIQDVNIFVHE